MLRMFSLRSFWCVSLYVCPSSYTCLHRLLYHISWDISVLGRTLTFSQLLAVLVSDRTALLAPEYKLLKLKKKKKKLDEMLWECYRQVCSI